jgi:hypothetical protein
VRHTAHTGEIGTLYEILTGKSQRNKQLVKSEYKWHKNGVRVSNEFN